MVDLPRAIEVGHQDADELRERMTPAAERAAEAEDPATLADLPPQLARAGWLSGRLGALGESVLARRWFARRSFSGWWP
jgi:hypothetical protein